MALVQRPRFYEGQVLGAADLTAGLEYARSQAARHDRVVHTWGIAGGLALKTTPQSGSVTVTVGAGLAIDGTGREVLVPGDVALDEQLFINSHVAVADIKALYPVLLAGADTPAAPGVASQVCSPAQAARTVESYQIAFGPPGAEVAVAGQAAPPFDQGAGGAANQPRWWILLGFVAWDATTSHFTSVAPTSNGVSRRYVGVHADEIAAQGATLSLRSDPVGVVGAPMVQLTRTSDTAAAFVFGLQDTAGNPSQLMKLDASGNLTIAGALSSSTFRGVVGVSSGIAICGDQLPLPTGVTDAMVSSGQVTLNTILSPEWSALPTGSVATEYPMWIGMSLGASVDSTRTLACYMRWVGFSAVGVPGPPVTEGAKASYLIIAVMNWI